MDGLTGRIKFDTRGFRSDFDMEIIELKKEGLTRLVKSSLVKVKLFSFMSYVSDWSFISIQFSQKSHSKDLCFINKRNLFDDLFQYCQTKQLCFLKKKHSAAQTVVKNVNMFLLICKKSQQNKDWSASLNQAEYSIYRSYFYTQIVLKKAKNCLAKTTKQL